MRDDRVLSSRLQRWEARFWTGPVAHLLGGALDVAGALSRHLLGRAARSLRGRLRTGGGAASARRRGA